MSPKKVAGIRGAIHAAVLGAVNGVANYFGYSDPAQLAMVNAVAVAVLREIEGFWDERQNKKRVVPDIEGAADVE